MLLQQNVALKIVRRAMLLDVDFQRNNVGLKIVVKNPPV